MPDNCYAVVTVDAANIRVQPQAETSIVGIARRDERLPAHRLSNPDAENFTWIRVTLPANNMQGWIREDLAQLAGDCAKLGALSTTVEARVDTAGTESEPEPLVSPPETERQPATTPEVLAGDCRGEVSVTAATVRSGAGLAHSIRGVLSRGNQFVIVSIAPKDDQGFHWFSFEFNGDTGWVREDLVKMTGDCLNLFTHLQPEADETPPPDERPSDGCLALVGLPRVSVRALPTTASARLGMGLKDETYGVKDITAPQTDGFTWVEIDFEGQDGYIRSDLVTLLGDCAAFTNDDRLARPVAGRITQGFRPSNNPSHHGVDFGTGGPQELRIALDATIDRAHFCQNCTGDPPNYFTSDPEQQRRIFSDTNWGFGYGHHIVLSHRLEDIPRSAQAQLRRMGASETDRVFVLYAHLSEMRVSVGEAIILDTIIGKTGNTGFSSAEHLHLETAFGSRWGSATKFHPAILFNIIMA
ncbi:MAG: peptidoglycan DD-metalloendopeptidase family protein [Chloroflexi bacterium]|nr:peptidoglycan DD-metalloendopeptidase family protein [Chloroflexota bacterium]